MTNISNSEKAVEEIKQKIVELDLEGTMQACQAAIHQGINPSEIIDGAITKAVEEIGILFEKGEFFLPELIFSGEILTRIIKQINATLAGKGLKKRLGKVVIATGKGDLHDIGKNIVSCFLAAEGFEVIDLGVDVSPDKLIRAIQEYKPKILAISALLTTTMLELVDTMKAIEQAGVRRDVKVILGGAPLTQAFTDQVGADAYAKNAMEGVRTCKGWAER